MTVDRRGLEDHVNPNGSAWLGHTRVMVTQNIRRGETVMVVYPDGSEAEIDAAALSRNRKPILQGA